MSSEPDLLHLRGVIQNYDWGLPANKGFVGRHFTGGNPDTPCAEYWIGDHPNGPAEVLNVPDSSNLLQTTSAHPDFYLGKAAASEWHNQLPFLFKVLSIGAPLSIQCHPDRETAIELHQSDPQHYPDSNHKPEIAVALTELTCLQGFRSPQDIFAFFPDRQSLQQALCGDRTLESLRDLEPEQCLEHFSTTLFTLDPEKIQPLCSALQDELERLDTLTDEDTWFMKTALQYQHNDIGLLCFYLLQLKTVAPGYAIYTGAGVPHAYLSGEIVECMARSDNTIRAGLTPKFRDTDTLLQMLDYTNSYCDIIEPTQGSFSQGRYVTPAKEFELERIVVDRERLFSLGPSAGPTVVFCLDGQIQISEPQKLIARSGEAFLIRADYTPAPFSCLPGEYYRVTLPESAE